MSRRLVRKTGFWTMEFVALPAFLILAAGVTPAFSQLVVAQNQRNIGGISVDADGVVRKTDAREQDEERLAREKFLAPVPDDLRDGVKLRKVSLKQMQQAVLDILKKGGKTVPDDVRYMAGLQRIRYVFVYPQQNDIVLVGPAEGWKVTEAGDVVGVTTGRPVLQLDDLLVALRTAAADQRGPITCSINPTPEGSQRLQKFLNTRPTIDPQGAALARAQQEMGMQQVTLSGIDPASRFARILVAADYRMKRLAMGFDRSPLKGMPSYLEMVRAARGVKNLNSRWWLQDDYQPLLTDGQGLAWELRGQGVKTMTEEEVIGKDGVHRGTGGTNTVAQKWANNFTSHYDELSGKETIFGELRNCMDLSVVATLIVSQKLPEKAGLNLDPMLTTGSLEPLKLAAPKQIPTLANALRVASGWLFSASGGISIDPWQTTSRQEKSAALDSVHGDSQPAKSGTSWRWN